MTKLTQAQIDEFRRHPGTFSEMVQAIYDAGAASVKESLTPQKRHRHESSMWFIAGGYWSWCYQCGAIKMNKPGERWQKPSSIGGPNPAMKGKK